MRRENLIFEAAKWPDEVHAAYSRLYAGADRSSPLPQSPSRQQWSLLYTLPIIATISRRPVRRRHGSVEMVPWALREIEKFLDLFFPPTNGCKQAAAMSALGQKRTSEHDRIMSALPPKADIGTGPVISVEAPTPGACGRKPPRLVFQTFDC